MFRLFGQVYYGRSDLLRCKRSGTESLAKVRAISSRRVSAGGYVAADDVKEVRAGEAERFARASTASSPRAAQLNLRVGELDAGSRGRCAERASRRTRYPSSAAVEGGALGGQYGVLRLAQRLVGLHPPRASRLSRSGRLLHLGLRWRAASVSELEPTAFKSSRWASQTSCTPTSQVEVKTAGLREKRADSGWRGLRSPNTST